MIEHLLHSAIKNSVTMVRLEAMAHAVVGARMAVLLEVEEQVKRLSLSGGTRPRSPFCERFGRTHRGQHQCATCRRLVSLTARYSGLSRHSCHGGITVLATAVPPSAPGTNVRLVVASCAFAPVDRAEGWRAIRMHARAAGVDLDGLREAYYRLPVLTPDAEQVMRGILDVTAATMGEIERSVARRLNAMDLRDGASMSEEDLVASRLQDALALARAHAAPKQAGGKAPSLFDLVVSLVRKDPAFPFSVALLARAAHLTPNHFSRMFHAETGAPFNAFLTEQRMDLAKTLLRNTALAVHEIASRAGFQDSSYFSRRFKRWTGLSPQAWRDGGTGKTSRS